jgi:hypothetical protein
MAADDDTVKLDQPEPELPTVDADPPVVTLKNRKVSVDLDAPQVLGGGGFKQGQTQKQSSVAAYSKAPGSAVAPPGAPPGGVIPVAVPAPTPDEPFLVRHRWKVLGGVLVLVVAITTAIVLIASGSGGDPDKDKATSVLSSSQQEFSRVVVSATQAGKTDTLAAVGRDADSAIATIQSLQTGAGSIKSQPVSAAVSGELGAEIQVLQGFSQLKAMKRDVKVLGTWQQQIHGVIDSAKTNLATAAAPVTALKLRDQAVVLPTAGAIDAAESHIDGVVADAISRLRAHQKKVAAQNRRKAGARQQAFAYRTYANQVVAIYQQYYDDRTATKNFLADAASKTPDALRSRLEADVATRNRTLSSLQAITPPAGVETQHAQLIQVVNLSLQGLNEYLQGIDEYFNTSATTPTETPSWQQGDATSGQVTSAWSSAKASWDSQLQSLVNQTQSQLTLPKLHAPDV